MSNEARLVSALEGYELWAESYDSLPNPIALMDARHSLRVLEPQAGELVLDAGCGTGRNLVQITLSGARAIGLDFSGAMLRAAAAKSSGARLVAADLQSPLPFADASFDAALCSLVGEHLAGIARTFAEFRRVLKPGGRLVFSVAHPGLMADGVVPGFYMNSREHRLTTHAHGVQDYLDHVADAGFEQIAFAEFRADARLALEAPGAGRFVGSQALLLIAAT